MIKAQLEVPGLVRLLASDVQGSTNLNGKGGLSNTSVSQHHQLVQRHFSSHGGQLELRTDEDKKTKDNQAREVSMCIAIQFADDVPIIISGERGGRVEIARRGKKGVEVAHVPGGGGRKRKAGASTQFTATPNCCWKNDAKGGGGIEREKKGGKVEQRN